MGANRAVSMAPGTWWRNAPQAMAKQAQCPARPTQEGTGAWVGGVAGRGEPGRPGAGRSRAPEGARPQPARERTEPAQQQQFSEQTFSRTVYTSSGNSRLFQPGACGEESAADLVTTVCEGRNEDPQRPARGVWKRALEAHSLPLNSCLGFSANRSSLLQVSP